MELTRRDVVAALAASGISSVAGCSQHSTDGTSGGTTERASISDHDVDTLVALAEVIYPSEAESVREFVGEYSAERVGADEAYARGVAEAVTTLDDYVDNWHGEPYSALSAIERSNALERMAVDTADPDPDGAPRERVRYYLVNELLFAFYSTPTGASLAGLENPPGHPGGAKSYQRGSTR